MSETTCEHGNESTDCLKCKLALVLADNARLIEIALALEFKD